MSLKEFTDLTPFIPHRPPLLLLDRILRHEEGLVVMAVEIREQSYGYSKGAVPAWFGVEYMAQSIGVYNGLNFAKPHTPPEIGFLVAARNYTSFVSEFPRGSYLEISVSPTLLVDTAGSFNCKIHSGGNLWAEALVTTYKPDAQSLEKLKRTSHEESRGENQHGIQN